MQQCFLRYILICAFFVMWACSSPNGDTNTLPSEADSDSKTDLQLKIPDSQCFVGEDFVMFHVLVPTTYEHKDSRKTHERLLWSMECLSSDAPRCMGTLLRLSSIEETQEVTIGDRVSLGGEVLSINGLKAVVDVAGGTFHVDAENGRVTYEGTALMVGPTRGYGEATCKHHGAPDVTIVPR